MSTRRVYATVDLRAIERNCQRLRSQLADGVALCAVVKADGYGHGAEQTARAALAAGAGWLAVAGSHEALELREAGLRDMPILVMGALSDVELAEALAAGADVVVWHERHVEKVARAGGGRVHVKLDTGMGRLGTRDPHIGARAVAAAAETAGVRLVGAMTHFATADDPDDDFLEHQLERFQHWTAQIKADHPEVLVHAANSAATLRDERTHFDMVRCGLAIYGMDPLGEDPLARGLEPALELCSYVAAVKRCAAGESTGYGRRFVAPRDTHLAVLPVGYGDGYRRGLSNNAEVLIDGRRHPLVGTVSMDNIAVDLGPDPQAMILDGRRAVLIGTSGEERITTEELARRLDSINYEITCGLTARVPRIYRRESPGLDPGDVDRTP
ncbi:MAG TPA: alanine racemase [Solirubrobacteraceae bacterium]